MRQHSDFEGDRIAARERADRALERGDSPLTHLWFGPLDRCRDCGYLVREVEPGRWICPCHEWSACAAPEPDGRGGQRCCDLRPGHDGPHRSTWPTGCVYWAKERSA